MRFLYPNPVKLRTLSIISYMQKNNQPLYIKDIARMYDVTETDASNRVIKLKGWKLIKYADRQKRGWGGYVLTDYGKNFIVRDIQ